MRILVACEESQVVTTELRRLGHEAYSCDVLECSGEHPEWHIKQDVLPLLNGWTTFSTLDGLTHKIEDRWDMIIAFPPCTHLAVSGASYFAQKREDGRQREGIWFFCQILDADCDRIAIENPVGIIQGDYVKKYFPDLAEKYGLPRKPTQTIQPYEFGHQARKKTCLWLKGLPQQPTNIVSLEDDIKGNGYSMGASLYYATDEKGRILRYNDPRTARIRSRTFDGVGKAMAEQWAGECE